MSLEVLGKNLFFFQLSMPGSFLNLWLHHTRLFPLLPLCILVFSLVFLLGYLSLYFRTQSELKVFNLIISSKIAFLYKVKFSFWRLVYRFLFSGLTNWLCTIEYAFSSLFERVLWNSMKLRWTKKERKLIKDLRVWQIKNFHYILR